MRTLAGQARTGLEVDGRGAEFLGGVDAGQAGAEGAVEVVGVEAGGAQGVEDQAEQVPVYWASTALVTTIHS